MIVRRVNRHTGCANAAAGAGSGRAGRPRIAATDTHPFPVSGTGTSSVRDHRVVIEIVNAAIGTVSRMIAGVENIPGGRWGIHNVANPIS